MVDIYEVPTASITTSSADEKGSSCEVDETPEKMVNSWQVWFPI